MKIKTTFERAFTRLIMAGTAAALSNAAQALPPVNRIPGELPPLLAQSHYFGAVNPNTVINFSFALPLHNEAQLDNMLTHLYTPGDPLYGHYLSVAQFTSLFSPTPQQYAQTAAWAKANGFAITSLYPNRLELSLQGTAAQIEKTFQVKLNNYIAPDGTLFRSPDTNPLAPPVPVAAIAGLDSLKPKYLLGPPPGGTPGPLGNGIPPGGLDAAALRKAYNVNNLSQNGAGQTLGLVEFSTYDPQDPINYEIANSLPAVPLQNVSIDGTDPGNGGEIEVDLDIEVMAAMAPQAAQIRVYIGSDTISMYGHIASENIAKQVSTSWGYGYNDSLLGVLSIPEGYIMKEMAMQGQTLYAASGDDGSNNYGYPNSVGDPASQPYITGAGGTSLTLNNDGTYNSESVWNGGGGGISQMWAIPSYQSHYFSSFSQDPQASKTMRNVPDISADADPYSGYSIAFGGGFVQVGGTSAVAPLWAGYTALVNQARSSAGEPPIGFINPALYSIAEGPNYATDFHDITTGSNGTYNAYPGYDNGTGLGSMVADKLITDLVNFGKLPVPLPPPTSGNLLLDPGFEDGSTQSAWQLSSSSLISSSSIEPPNTGSWDAWMVGSVFPHWDTLQQSFTYPSGVSTATLSFALHVDTGVTYKFPLDLLIVQIIDPVRHTLVKTVGFYSNLNAASDYITHTFTLPATAGQTLALRVIGLERSFQGTNFVLDDFSLTAR